LSGIDARASLRLISSGLFRFRQLLRFAKPIFGRHGRHDVLADAV
jgi:hypothetical protein